MTLFDAPFRELSIWGHIVGHCFFCRGDCRWTVGGYCWRSFDEFYFDDNDELKAAVTISEIEMKFCIVVIFWIFLCRFFCEMADFFASFLFGFLLI